MTDTMRDQEVRRFKIVLCKAGLDAHDRGVHVVALGLRDAGDEVVYLGLRRSPREVVSAALQEDADFIGVSSLAGGHATYLQDLMAERETQGCRAAVVLGGLIQPEEVPAMEALGVAAVFTPGTMVADIHEILTELASA